MLRVLILAALAAAAAAIDAPNTTLTPPVPIRECFIKNDTLVPLLPELATALETVPQFNISAYTNFTPYRSSITVNSTCLQVLAINTDCFYSLSVTGSGLAHSVRGVAAQCGGEGWAFYTDAETGETYHESVWVIVRACSSWAPKGTCKRLICPTDTTGLERHDPSLPCPGD